MTKSSTPESRHDTRHAEILDEPLAPVALGTVATDQPENGLDRLTRGGGTGEFDQSWHQGFDLWL